MQRRFFYVVTFLCGLWFSKALADDMQICKDVFALQEANVLHRTTDNPVDLAATTQLMSSLSLQVKHVRAFNMPVGVDSQTDALGIIASALDRAMVQSVTHEKLVANLSSLRTDIEMLTIIFGCEFVASTEVAGREAKPLAMRRTPDGDSADEGLQALENPIVLSSGALGVLVALTAIIARLGLRGRAKRELCNTSVLVSVKNGCTKTRIVDINRNGVKIEAASFHVPNASVDLYFCGRHRRGKIRWKNEYFAGILFKRRISQAAVADVVAKSHTLMEGSGIETNTLPCYRADCHLGCSKYCPSAIAERQENESVRPVQG